MSTSNFNIYDMSWLCCPCTPCGERIEDMKHGQLLGVGKFGWCCVTMNRKKLKLKLTCVTKSWQQFGC